MRALSTTVILTAVAPTGHSQPPMSLINIVDRRKHWWKVFASICILSVAVVGYVGVKTYTYAPPICDFVDAE